MIYILYRDTGNITGWGKKRPSWYKFRLGIESLISTIEGNSNVELHILYDLGKGEKEFPWEMHPRMDKIVTFKGGSDWNSYVYAWNYAKTLDMKENDLIFLAENDYVFAKGWADKVLELFSYYNNIDYVSLYDHPDKYNMEIYPNLSTYLFVTKTHHWRTVPSTTGSIIFGSRILKEDFELHTTNPSDRDRGMILTGTRLRNILSPVPSLSTHCETDYLSPTINWENII